MHNPHKITRDSTGRVIVSQPQDKQYKIVYDKRVIQPDLDTLPMGIDTYKIKLPMGVRVTLQRTIMWMRMWMLHTMARMVEDPPLERGLASIKYPTTMLLTDLMRCCNTVFEGDAPRRWGVPVQSYWDDLQSPNTACSNLAWLKGNGPQNA